MKTFKENFILWGIPIAIYFHVRFADNPVRPEWVSSFTNIILVWFVASLLFAFFLTLTDIIIAKPAVRKRPYGIIILLRVFMVLFALIIVAILARYLVYIQGDISFSEIFYSLIRIMKTDTFIAGYIYFIICTFIIAFIKQMQDMIGRTILYNLLIGKYHSPKIEERIFMFLDLKSSTTHAENLGHVKFTKLIQDCFSDLTDAILLHDVEVYQYVGDEAILTWTIEDGLRNNNCIYIYFDFIKSLNKKEAYYQKNYGFLPHFKAGVEMGSVSVAEIGEVKRNIAYLSDVLNTAARIEGICNKLNENLIISKGVYSALEDRELLNITEYPSIELEGKSKYADVYGIQTLK